MKFCILNIPIDPLMPVQSLELIEQFCQSHHVVNYVPHLMSKDSSPFWSIFLSYRDKSEGVPAPKTAAPSSKRLRLDPRKEMPPEQVELYEQLRTWRNDTAVKEGKPPYIIFSNAQLAELVSRRPQSISAMRQIDGIGEGLSATYGPAILAILNPKTDP